MGNAVKGEMEILKWWVFHGRNKQTNKTPNKQTKPILGLIWRRKKVSILPLRAVSLAEWAV